MSVYEASALHNRRQRSTARDEDEVLVSVGPRTTVHADLWVTTYEIENSQLCKAITKLSQALHPTGEYVNTTREVAMSVTSAVNELKMVSIEPGVWTIWQLRSACQHTAAAVDAAYDYIDKIDDVPWYGCSAEMRSLAQKATTYSSISEDLKAFKQLIEEMMKALSAAEEYYHTLKAECDQAVRFCSEAEAVCNRKAREQRNKKVMAQAVGGTLAAAGIGAAVVGGIAATITIGIVTFGIGAPVAAGVTAAVVGGIGATAGTAGVGTAIVTAAVADAFDKTAKAFSDAGRKCASVGASALRLSCAAANVRRDLVRVSKELDGTLDMPLYTSIATTTAIITVVQTGVFLLLNNSTAARTITAECRQKVLVQKEEVAHHSCC